MALRSFFCHVCGSVCTVNPEDLVIGVSNHSDDLRVEICVQCVTMIRDASEPALIKGSTDHIPVEDLPLLRTRFSFIGIESH